MLWYKAWLETRWRFVSGLVLLLLAACAMVISYPRLMALARLATLEGELGRQISEQTRDYRSYIWHQRFLQTMRQLWALCAVVLGTGGLLAQASSGGALFTLSLPISRARLLGVRAAAGLAELLILALVPALVIPLMSPAIGESYRVVDALVHGACMFIAGSVLFSLTFLLSTVFNDVWRPPLITLCVAIVLRMIEVATGLEHVSLLAVMTAEPYFRGDGVPWLGLAASAAISVGLIVAATRNIARQDF